MITSGFSMRDRVTTGRNSDTELMVYTRVYKHEREYILNIVCRVSVWKLWLSSVSRETTLFRPNAEILFIYVLTTRICRLYIN